MLRFGLILVAGLAVAGLAVPVRAQTLQDAMISAYRGNPQLQSDRARQRSVDEDVSRAWGGYRPQVNVTGQTGRAKDIVTYPPGTPDNPITSYNPNPSTVKYEDARSPNLAQLQITQEVWDGNRTFADVAHSKWAVANGRAQLISTEQSVLGGVTQAFYDLWRDEKILELQKEYVQSLRDEQKATKARYAVQDVTQTDVAQSDARLARGLADQEQYDGNVEASKSAFLRAAGFPPAHLVPPEGLPVGLPQSLDDALAQVNNNPDLQAAIYAEKAAESDVDMAESGLLPNLALQASSNRYYNTDSSLSTSYGSQVMLTLTLPLYDGGVAAAQTRKAKHTVGQRRLDIDATRDSVVDQVKRSWENLRAVRARISSLQENIKAATIALKGVQQEVRVGSRTVLDELNAHQELLDSEINLVRSQHDEAISAYSLLIAIGRLTAVGLDLPVERYDPAQHYKAVSWQPWSPWIGTDYPDGPKDVKKP